MAPLYLPIRVQTTGELRHGLILRKIVVNPPSIQVLALPQGKELIHILTEPINLQDIFTTSTFTPKLVLPQNVRFVGDKPPPVQVIVEIEGRKMEDSK
jgi:YbbR domain-containing protein